jgi:sugar phosphate isomerase/epimerase
LHFTIEETIRKVADLGYAGIEVLADAPHAWPAMLLESQKRSIRQHLDHCGLAVSNVNAFMMNAVGDPRQPYWHPGWTDPDPHYRAIRREHTKRALRLAKELGATSVSTEPGGLLAAGQTRQEASKIFYDEIMPCVEIAEKLELSILIEPEPDLFIERFEQFLEFSERVASPSIALNFDIGHAYCVGEDPQDWVERMAPWTRHYHCEDIASTRVHRHLIPGRGAIDFDSTLAAIRRTGYSGWITVELYPHVDNPDDAGREARDYLLGVERRLNCDQER